MKSIGKCAFCGKEFSKSTISRHLDTHLAKTEPAITKGKSYHLRIESHPRWGKGPYFLNIMANGTADFDELDIFLRKIWLECCGHMSAFRIPQLARRGSWDIMKAYDLLDQGKIKEYERIMEQASGEIPKSRKLSKVLSGGLKIDYEYDFGSSTELQLMVLQEYDYQVSGIELLSRNEPLEILCDSCGKRPAITLCSVCNGYEKEGYFCKNCATKHGKTCSDFKDYAAMPVVNSPRMGVCAYEGGIIDMDRDQPYQMQDKASGI